MFEKGKTYCLGVIGEGAVSRIIQDFSDCDISLRQRWSHVAALFWHWSMNAWCVVESHADSGVRLWDFIDWVNENRKKQVFAFEYGLSPIALLKLLGRPYGFSDIFRIARKTILFPSVEIKGLGLAQGIFCSELLAMCDRDIITKELNKNAEEIRPVDFQSLAHNLLDVHDLFTRGAESLSSDRT